MARPRSTLRATSGLTRVRNGPRGRPRGPSPGGSCLLWRGGGGGRGVGGEADAREQRSMTSQRKGRLSGLTPPALGGVLRPCLPSLGVDCTARECRRPGTQAPRQG